LVGAETCLQAAASGANVQCDGNNGCINYSTSYDQAFVCDLDTIPGTFNPSNVAKMQFWLTGNSNGATAELCFTHGSATTLSCGTPATNTGAAAWIDGAKPSGTFNSNYFVRAFVLLNRMTGATPCVFKSYVLLQ
jgi:hypothetical protein